MQKIIKILFIRSKFASPAHLDGKNIFELGFGIGRMTARLAQKARKVVGCDFTPLMVDEARKNLASFNNVDLRLGKITQIELAPKSFDLVFDAQVLIHILNVEELMETIEKMKLLADRVFVVEHIYDDAL